MTVPDTQGCWTIQIQDYTESLPQTCQVLTFSEWQPVRSTRGTAHSPLLPRPQDPQSPVGVSGDPPLAPSAQAAGPPGGP